MSRLWGNSRTHHSAHDHGKGHPVAPETVQPERARREFLSRSFCVHIARFSFVLKKVFKIFFHQPLLMMLEVVSGAPGSGELMPLRSPPALSLTLLSPLANRCHCRRRPSRRPAVAAAVTPFTVPLTPHRHLNHIVTCCVGVLPVLLPSPRHNRHRHHDRRQRHCHRRATVAADATIAAGPTSSPRRIATGASGAVTGAAGVPPYVRAPGRWAAIRRGRVAAIGAGPAPVGRPARPG
jgi:hypothetical protein